MTINNPGNVSWKVSRKISTGKTYFSDSIQSEPELSDQEQKSTQTMAEERWFYIYINPHALLSLVAGIMILILLFSGWHWWQLVCQLSLWVFSEPVRTISKRQMNSDWRPRPSEIFWLATESHRNESPHKARERITRSQPTQLSRDASKTGALKWR